MSGYGNFVLGASYTGDDNRTIVRFQDLQSSNAFQRLLESIARAIASGDERLTILEACRQVGFPSDVYLEIAREYQVATSE